MLPVVTVESAKVQGGPPAIVVTLICLAAAAVFTILSVMYFIYKKRNNKALYYVIILTNLAILAAFVTTTTYSVIKQTSDSISKQQTEESITQSNKLIKPVKIVDIEKIKSLTPAAEDSSDPTLIIYEKDRMQIDSFYSYRIKDTSDQNSYIETNYIVYSDTKYNLKFAVKHTFDDGMNNEMYNYLSMTNSQTVVDQMKSKVLSDNSLITSVYWNPEDAKTSHFYEYNITDADNIGITENYKKISGTLNEPVEEYIKYKYTQ